MDSPWRIDMLGGLRAALGDRVVTRFRSHQTAGLLAYLAYHSHRSHPREELLERLWPERDPESGRNSFRVALSSLRRQLEPPEVPGGAVLVADRANLQLNPAAVVTDVAQFEAAIQAAGRAGTARNERQGGERAERLAQSVELYRGELLPGFFDDWILPERRRLADLFVDALDELVLLHEREGDLARALQYARRAVTTDPLREEAHQTVMRLLVALGQPGAALRQYEELEQLLAREMDSEVSPEIQALARRIQDHRPVSTDPLGETSVPIVADQPPSAFQATLPSRDQPASPASLPAGTVTFLLTDIEGSAALLKQMGEAFNQALTRHHALLRETFRRHGGSEVKLLGEGFLVAFQRAGDAVACAVDAQRSLAAVVVGAPLVGVRPELPLQGEPLRVRMALHTGDVEKQAGDYHGLVLHCAQRILMAGHGGQILCSEQTAGLVRSDLDPEVELVDLGVYRLRDVTTPERLFHVTYRGMGQQEFPPLTAAPAHTGQLPLRFTRFIGRQTEISHLCTLLSPLHSLTPLLPHSLTLSPRLITLTGPGGIGKSRLALEVADRLRDPLRGAVWFVPLMDLREPDLILDKILDGLRLPRSREIDPLEQIVTTLDRQPSLLLLDSFERLVSGGAPLVHTLLERAPALAVLVTSRLRLGLAGEHEFPVEPLPVPVDSRSWLVDGPAKTALPDLSTIHHPLSTLLQFPSVQLFVDRAQAARPDFQITPVNGAAVAALCARLEGLPLALELAAARARLLTPQQMLARLEHRFDLLVSRHQEADPRHRSLRAALDWSYELLAPELQRFFARLSSFRGGWTLAAAETVCEEPRALEYLEQLNDGSLVEAQEGSGARGQGPDPNVTPGLRLQAADDQMRYQLLETLREYGAGQLSPVERAGLARQHAQFFLALAEEAEPELLGPAQPVWLAKLEREHDNLRAALTWTEESGEIETGLRLAGALWEFWAPRGYLAEGRERLGRLLALATGADSSPVEPGTGQPDELPTDERERNLEAARAKALACAGVLAHYQGDFPAARRLQEQSLALRRDLGDRWGIAFSLTALAFVARFQGDYDEARSLQEEGMAIWRELGNIAGIAWALNNLADVAGSLGDYAAERTLHEQSLSLRRELGDQWGAAFSLTGLGGIAEMQGDLEGARAFYTQSLAIRRELGDQVGIATSVTNLANVALCQADVATARSLYEEGLAIRQSLGDQSGIGGSLYHLGIVAFRQGDWAAARSLLQESLALRRDLREKEGIAASLEGLAGVALAQGQPERAARLFSAADSLREATGALLPPPDRAEYDRLVAVTRDRLGETAFAAAWKAGRTMSWEQATAEALAAGAEGAGVP